MSADTLTGSGTLTVESGTLDIEAPNPNLHTNNVLFTEAKVNMKSSSGLGDGTIELDGELNLNGVCLLYTSPSPRDGLLSRMPSSA